MTSSGTIIMAVYRPDPALLERQLASLRHQSLRDWVCLVGIDGRDGASHALLRRLVGDDARFEVHEFETNVGHYRNFARLAELAARGSPPWVAFADQDDWWYPDKLERLLVPLREGAVGITGQANVVDRGASVGATRRKQVALLSLLCSNQVTGSTSVFRGEVLAAACPFPAPRASSYHDHWFGVVSSALGDHLFVDDVVQDYVQHDFNVLGEERGARLAGRLRNLTCHPFRALTYERWGWRVAMAQELRVRVPSMRSDLDVNAIARGRISGRLLVSLLRVVLRGEVPLMRGLALALGAALSSTPRARRMENA